MSAVPSSISITDNELVDVHDFHTYILVMDWMILSDNYISKFVAQQ